jgi:hypothetical protein
MATGTYQKRISVPPEQVYSALTNSTYLREWLCDSATVQNGVGGRFFAWWNNGHYVAGEFTQLEPNRSASFVWQPRMNKELSTLQVNIEGNGSSALLSLSESGQDSGIEWEDALINLVSVLETGRDLRIVQRPMLGITVSDFNPEIAEQMGIPVDEGIRIDDVISGMGAEEAGLARSDVIVEIGGMKVTNWPSLAAALQTARAGDAIEVSYFRGSQLNNVKMTLSARQIPDVPQDPKDLAKQVEQNYIQVRTELEKTLDEITDEEASYSPGAEVWSIKDILAHLIISERYTHIWITEILTGQESWSDDWGGNSTIRGQALIAVYPTIEKLIDLLRKTEMETIELVRALPEQFVARRGGYWRIGTNLLMNSVHTRGHLEQINTALQAARNR